MIVGREHIINYSFQIINAYCLPGFCYENAILALAYYTPTGLKHYHAFTDELSLRCSALELHVSCFDSANRPNQVFHQVFSGLTGSTNDPQEIKEVFKRVIHKITKCRKQGRVAKFGIILYTVKERKKTRDEREEKENRRY